MIRWGLAAAGGGGALSTLLAAGWVGVALVILLIFSVLGTVCWVVADAERPARLALLITSWRGPSAAVGTQDSPDSDHEAAGAGGTS
jgi:hypothetical protein